LLIRPMSDYHDSAWLKRADCGSLVILVEGLGGDMNHDTNSHEYDDQIIRRTDELAEQIDALEKELNNLRLRLHNRGHGLAHEDTVDVDIDIASDLKGELLESSGIEEQTRRVVAMLDSSNELEKRASRDAERVDATIARLEEKIVNLGRRAEAVMDLQLTLERIGRDLGPAEEAKHKLVDLALSAKKLDEKLSSINDAAENTQSSLQAQQAIIRRIEEIRPGLSELAKRLEDERMAAELSEISHRAGRQLEARLVSLISDITEREKGLKEAIAQADQRNREFENFFHLKKRAVRNIEQINEGVNRAERVLEKSENISEGLLALSDRLDAMRARIDQMENLSGEIKDREESFIDLKRKIDEALRSAEILESHAGLVRAMEEKINAIVRQVEELKIAAQERAQSAAEGKKLIHAVKEAAARFEEMTARMESAEVRLDTATALQRELSSMEDRSFQITKRLESLEDKGRAVISVEEKIAQLQSLLEMMDNKLNRLLS